MKHLALLLITICVLAIVAAALDIRCGVSADRDLVAVVCRSGRLIGFMGGIRDE